MEVLDAVDRVTNMKINRIAAARRPGDPDELVSDNSAILRELGWSPQFQDLDLIVKHALAWERKLTEISGLRGSSSIVGRSAANRHMHIDEWGARLGKKRRGRCGQ